MAPFPIGKLPYKTLDQLLRSLESRDPRVILGPGVGLDCAVIDFGETYLVAKSDPITFTAEDIGWYAVHVNANDIVTTGARPKWFIATLLLPEGTDSDLVERIFADLGSACAEVGAELVGGHTEITTDLNRPILSGTMLGEVKKQALITPEGARPGDLILLSKGIPIEAGSIIARECLGRLQHLDQGVLNRARDYLTDPGISIVTEALTASQIGGVSAMHDPTEGGLASGLWELADACGYGLAIEHAAIPVLPEAKLLCRELDLDPLAAIASGALLFTVKPTSIKQVTSAIEEIGVPLTQIGEVTEGRGVFFVDTGEEMHRPERDELTKLFEDPEN